MPEVIDDGVTGFIVDSEEKAVSAVLIAVGTEREQDLQPSVT